VRLSASLFPADAALANRGGVPLGAVVHPFRDGETFEGAASSAFPSMTIQKPPARCETCGAFANGFCAVNARNGHWACCFCGSGNTHRSLIVPLDADAAALPELAAREVEYVWTPSRDDSKDSKDSKSPSDLRATDSATEGSAEISVGALRTTSTYSSREREPSRPPVVFVLDESLDLDESRLMRGSVARALDALPDGTRVGLVAFADAVSAYDVRTDAGLAGFDGGDVCFAAASVVPGHRSPDARDLSAILDEKRGGPSRCIARLGDEGVRETLAAIVASLAPAGNKRREGAARTRPRSFGAAVETAVAVLDGASARDAGTRDAKNADTASRGRVIVCLGGPPTRGPGAAAADEQSEFYDAEERAARAYVETLAETVRFFFFFFARQPLSFWRNGDVLRACFSVRFFSNRHAATRPSRPAR
jgi:protein transport protein SEC23